MTYATEDLLEEVAYLAAAFHWPLDTLLDLEHPDRHRFLEHAKQLLEAPARDDHEREGR